MMIDYIISLFLQCVRLLLFLFFVWVVLTQLGLWGLFNGEAFLNFISMVHTFTNLSFPVLGSADITALQCLFVGSWLESGLVLPLEIYLLST